MSHPAQIVMVLAVVAAASAAPGIADYGHGGLAYSVGVAHAAPIAVAHAPVAHVVAEPVVSRNASDCMSAEEQPRR